MAVNNSILLTYLFLTAIVYIFDFIVYVLHDLNIMLLRTILSAKFTSSMSVLWMDNKVVISHLINGFQEHLPHVGICCYYYYIAPD